MSFHQTHNFGDARQSWVYGWQVFEKRSSLKCLNNLMAFNLGCKWSCWQLTKDAMLEVLCSYYIPLSRWIANPSGTDDGSEDIFDFASRKKLHSFKRFLQLKEGSSTNAPTQIMNTMGNCTLGHANRTVMELRLFATMLLFIPFLYFAINRVPILET